MHDALGIAGRARRVGDEREVVVPRVGRGEVFGTVGDEAVPVERVRRSWVIAVAADDDVSQTGAITRTRSMMSSSAGW
jgi:hypothetical protein